MTTTFDTGQLGSAAAVALNTARDGFPEPTLLPHLAQSVSASEIPALLDTVDEVGSGRGEFPPWPRLISATSAIVAQRLSETEEQDVVYILGHCHSELFSHVDVSVLDTTLHLLTPEVDSWNATERAENLCRVAARHPDYGGGVFVDFASAALLDLSAERSLAASAWFLPLTNGAERRRIIDAWCQSDWPDLGATTALFTSANDSERALLTSSFLAFLATRVPHAAAAALATVWPMLADESHAQSQAQFASVLRNVATSVPAWWFGLLWSRTCATEVGVEFNLGIVDPAWADWLESLGPLPRQSAYADVLRAHPGASQWMTADGYPGFSPEIASTLLNAIMSRWRARRASAAPPEASAPPSAPRAEPPPRRRRAPTSDSGGGRYTAQPPGRGGLLGGLLGGRRRGGGSILGGLLGAGRGTASRTGDVMRSAPPEELPDRRLQADVGLASEAGTPQPQVLTRAFVAGAKHVVQLSVGRGASLGLDVSFTEPTFAEDSEFETLQVRFLHDNAVTGGSIDLPRDTSKDSSVWPASLQVTAGADKAEATIVVLHNSKVLQVAKLSGPVVSSLDAATAANSEIEFSVVADVHELANLAKRSAFDASFVSDGKSGAAFSGDKYRVQDLRGIDTSIKKMTEKLFKSTEAVVMAGGDGNPERHRALLVFLAVHGKALHSKLIKPKLSALDKAKRIQVVNAGDSPVLPLEFVYAGPSPTHGAELCDGWREALSEGKCPTCTPQPDGVRVDTICPLNFWALSKIIERHAPGEPRPDGYDYSLETCIPGERDQLMPLKRTLFAASDNVPEDQIEATLGALRKIDSSCDEALNWEDWLKGVASTSPTLLVSMPHNALDPTYDIPTLEIGRGSDLRAGEVTRGHVCKNDVEVGPVVLLLGCQTAQSGPLPYHTFVSEFRDNGAAIVIGTLATVLGEHAAPIVRVILAELAKAADPEENTFGDLLLRMRRQMFAEGILISLAVAAFGDAEWSLADPGN